MQGFGFKPSSRQLPCRPVGTLSSMPSMFCCVHFLNLEGGQYQTTFVSYLFWRMRLFYHFMEPSLNLKFLLMSQLGSALEYLSDHIRPPLSASSLHPLCSSNSLYLFLPRVRTTMAQIRSFASIGPSLSRLTFFWSWNALKSASAWFMLWEALYKYLFIIQYIAKPSFITCAIPTWILV